VNLNLSFRGQQLITLPTERLFTLFKQLALSSFFTRTRAGVDLGEIRTASYLLHPPLLDEAGLSSALSWYVQGVEERSGKEIDLSISDDFGRLPADMELAIFRMVQECLTNIHRHAESQTARIRVSRENGTVCIEVQDAGKGISPERLSEIRSRGSGVGIGGIQERLRQFRGDIKIESNGSGTVVLATVPIPDEIPRRSSNRFKQRSRSPGTNHMPRARVPSLSEGSARSLVFAKKHAKRPEQRSKDPDKDSQFRTR
jgi:signal transduction histidine kinase